MNAVVNRRNARKGGYQTVIDTIHKQGKCPFCKENFAYHKNPILKRKNGWFISKNSWPYKNTKYHFIIIGEKHKEKFSELTKNDFEAVSYLTNWVIKKFKIPGGALTMRFGDTNLTGASVTHLHFNVLSPQRDKKTKRSKTVTFPIG